MPKAKAWDQPILSRVVPSRAIRRFNASTFRDMHGGREELVKALFPSRFQRPVEASTIAAGSTAGPVLKEYSSRWAPSSALTNTQAIGTRPCPPDFYQCPEPLDSFTARVAAPYQSAVAGRSSAAWQGLGSASPSTAGRPIPDTTRAARTGWPRAGAF